MSSTILPKSLRPKTQEKSRSEFPKTLRPKEEQKEENPSFESDEDLDREIERNQAQITSRMFERLFGSFGNAYQMTPNILKKINPLNFLYEKIPTEAKLREFSEKASGGYTKPQNEFEEKVGNVAADVASYATGKPGKTILGTTARMIGIPLAGELAKEGIELAGGDESSQQYGKLGTQVLLDLWNAKKGVGGGGAKKFGINKLEQAEKSIPKNAMADVEVLGKQLTNIEKDLRKGITGPHTSEALRAIDEIRNHFQNGHMEASRFPKLRQDINKLIENMQGFTLGGPTQSIKKTAVDNLNQVKSAVIQAGNRWGRGNSPEFFQNWREGNEALAVYSKSNELARFFSKNTNIKNPVLKTVLGLSTYHHPVGALALGAAKKGIELGTRFPTAMIYRFFKSKVLRNLYTNILKEAGKGSGASVSSTAKKMEKEMKKEGIE